MLRRSSLWISVVLCAGVVIGAPSAPAIASPGTNVWPPSKSSSALPFDFDGAGVFDPATGQLLLTNGAQTWSWDGLGWSQLHPATTPGEGAHPVLGYDAKTHLVVMFGGSDAPGTWTWNGVDWAQAQPTTEPTERLAGCAGYDSATGQFIMFGGSASGAFATPRSDTWSWADSDWAQLDPAASPPGGPCAMTYDPDAGGLVMVTIGSIPLDEPVEAALPQVWLWDGATWRQIASSLPEATELPSIAYDVDAGALIVDDPAYHADGGANNNIWGGVESEEWRWDGVSWTMLGTTTLSTKILHAGVLTDDAATHQLVLQADSTTFLCRSAGSSVVTPQRVYGANRDATAIAASQLAFPTDQSAGAVVLARSDAFADALAGGPLAAAKNAPLLLTPSSVLDDATKAEIQRVLKPGGTVYLLGGEAALSGNVAAAISALGDIPVRLAGADRFGTALAIADAMGDPSTVFAVSGVSFADALSAVPAAVESGGAIVLTNAATLPSSTANYLAAHPGLHYAVGGPAAAAVPAAIALVGADRYATSRAVASAIFPNATGVAIASGTAFPDALAGGPIAGAAGWPMLLVPPSASTLPEPSAAYLATRDGAVASLRIFGGDAAIADTVVDTVGAALAGS